MKFNKLTIIIVIVTLSACNTKILTKHDYTTEELKKIEVSPEKTLNSIGQKITLSKGKEIMLNKFPFQVTRCDQIVTFKAKYIPDMGEYRHREEGWFTLTAHYSNLFKTETAEQLLRSVLMADTNVAPSHLRGTGSCILITAGFSEKDFTICLNDKNEEANILQVLNTFFGCRGGQSLKTIDKLALTKEIINCGKGGRFIDPRILLRRLKKKKNKQEAIVKSRDFFHPGSDGVPGVPGTGNRDIYQAPRAK